MKFIANGDNFRHSPVNLENVFSIDLFQDGKQYVLRFNSINGNMETCWYFDSEEECKAKHQKILGLVKFDCV